MRTVYRIRLTKCNALWKRIEAGLASIPGCVIDDGGYIIVDEASGGLPAVRYHLESLGVVDADDPARGVEAMTSQTRPDYWVLHLHEWTEADRLAADWLWYRNDIVSTITGDFSRGGDGRLCGRGVRVPRWARVTGRHERDVVLTDSTRRELEALLGTDWLRGADLRPVEVESWADGIGLRAPLCELVPRRELPRMPDGAVRRCAPMDNPEPDDGDRYGPIYTPGFTDGRLVYPREALDALGGADAAWTWEHFWRGEPSPFLVVSQRFYREVVVRYAVAGVFVPVGVV